MIEEVRCGRGIAAPAPAVWRLLRAFCAPWHPWIRTMTAERGGVQRAFTVAGESTLYRERLTWFSDSDRTLAYRHIDGIAGCRAYDARLEVRETGGGAEVLWSARIDAPAGRAAEIAAGTGAVFEAGLAEIARLAAGTAPDAPSPAPPAADPVRLSDLRLDGDPPLALTVTPERGGPPCLFLHGIGGGRGNWDAQLRLAGTVTRAAALDFRGYGGSGLPGRQTTIEDYSADILRVRAALGADRLVLCGLSYGAWVATAFAMRYPGLLAGLVLSGGCTGMSEAGAAEREAFRKSREAPLDAGRTPADFAASVVDAIAGPTISDDVRARLRDSMSAIPARTYRDAVTCFTRPPGRFDFSKLSMPVLLMTGAHDRLAPPDEIRAVGRRILDAAAEPDVRFEVIAGAGHVCNLERPDAYNRLLLEFLGRLTG